jgi:hypothetical protein
MVTSDVERPSEALVSGAYGRRFLRWSRTFAALGILGLRLTMFAGDTAISEYELRATFIYNFTKFTDWPADAFASPRGPIVIGIVGEDLFGTTIDDLVRGELVHNRPLVVRRLRPEDDLRSCHLLFISFSEKDRIPFLLRQLQGSPVLTVSEIEGFASQGGMVNLLVVNKNLKIEINQEAVEQSGLQISAKLLRLAHLVAEKPKPTN